MSDVFSPEMDEAARRLSRTWLVRIHAQWFPIGMRFLIRGGIADGPGAEARYLVLEEGWSAAPEDHSREKMGTLIRRYGLDPFWTRRAIERHAAPIWQPTLIRAIDDAMYEPHAIQLLEIDEYMTGASPAPWEER